MDDDEPPIRCRLCDAWKPRSQFHKNSARVSGLDDRCVVCRAAQKRLERYDLAPAEYLRMFFVQNGRCAICDRRQDELDSSLCVDHDHVTGIVRALLCQGCNRGLGQFADNPDWLSRAATYVTLWVTPTETGMLQSSTKQDTKGEQ